MSRLGVLANTSALAGFAEYGVTVGKDSKRGTCKGERAQPAWFLRRCLGKASPCPGLTAQFAATLFRNVNWLPCYRWRHSSADLRPTAAHQAAPPASEK